jgi:hypothetical protein
MLLTHQNSDVLQAVLQYTDKHKRFKMTRQEDVITKRRWWRPPNDMQKLTANLNETSFFCVKFRG